MAKLEYGLLCPEGHGVLVEREDWTARGVAWCPNQTHDLGGQNGRFYRLQEVVSGAYNPDKPGEKSQALIDMEKRAEERALERQEVWKMATQAKAKAAAKEPKAPRERKAVATQACGCGCGGTTKGGRFLPGHDARFHGRVKLLVAAGVGHDEAEQVAAKGPLTGKYAVITEKPKAAPKAEKVEATENTAPAETAEEAEPVIAQ